MGEVKDIEENLEHEVAELICLKCLKRWIGVYPTKTWLNQLECKCGAVGFVIKTGQTIAEEPCETCRFMKNNHCTLNLSANSDYCEYKQDKESE